ncbi:hypothetical protein [Roseivivax sp. CAU 1761]
MIALCNDDDIVAYAGRTIREYGAPETYSHLEIDVIHMDPTPDGPDEAVPADEIGPDTLVCATVKNSCPLTLESHTIVEEIEDRPPSELDDILQDLGERYPGAEPDIDILDLGPSSPAP